MKASLKLLIRLLLLPVYCIGYLVPRKKNRWVFGEANGFNNNSKYLFLETIEEHNDIQAFWIGDKKTAAELNEKGLPAYFRYSFGGIWYALTSKIFIVSSTPGDVNFYASAGAKVINLWHGVGVKACLWANPLHSCVKQKGWLVNFVHFLSYPHLYIKPTAVLATSVEMMREFFIPTFEVREDRYIVNVYPRCKFMMQSKYHILEHIRKYETANHLYLLEKIKKFNKVIIYAPTFRDAGGDFVKASGIDFEDLNDELSSINALFIVKFHPATEYDPSQFDKYSNILNLDKSFDLYLIMPFSDVLVTDYSSIAYDYILLDKPVEIFAFDKYEYLEKSRKMLIPFDSAINGFSISNTYKELKEHILGKCVLLKACNVERWWTANYDLYNEIKIISIR